MVDSFPNAEILACGSELLTPTKIDSNSLWLTDQLNALGIEVVAKAIIGDDRERMAEAVRSAASRSDFLFITGGLGPTEDDVTRDAVAAATGRGQEFRQELLDQIAARFQRFNRPMAENNRRQAMLITGAEALPNDRGTAPGQWLDTGSCRIVLLPGPPKEMKAMFELQVLPRLGQLIPQAVLRTRWYRTTGIGESDLDQLIAPVYTRYTNPATTILAAPGDVHIHLRARCESDSEAETLLEDLGNQIEALLGDRIYSTCGATLEAVVGQLLSTRHETVSVAESISGGGLGERLTRVSGSSKFFQGGAITYSDEMKTLMLGVDSGLLKRESAVSAAVAEAMAQGARERFGTDWAVSITGEAGPEAATSAAVGTVYIGVTGPTYCSVYEHKLGGDRDRIRGFSVTYALDHLRRALVL